MSAIIAFSISFAALVFFIALKLFESKREVRMYTSLREKGDVLVVLMAKVLRARVRSIEEKLSVQNILQIFMQHAARIVARTARNIERRAKDVTRKMARNENGEIRITKSKFLEEVSTHKKGLDTERVRRETSLTERSEE